MRTLIFSFESIEKDGPFKNFRLYRQPGGELMIFSDGGVPL